MVNPVFYDIVAMFLPAPTTIYETIMFNTFEGVICIVVIIGSFRLINTLAKMIVGGR